MGSAGDVFYWPDTYWHVGEGDGTLTATITLGVDFRAEPATLFSDSLRPFLRSAETPPATGYHVSATGLPVEVEAAYAKLNSGAMPEMLRQNVLANWLVLRSTCGLSSPIPMSNVSEAPTGPLFVRDDVEVFHLVHEDTLSVFVHGHRLDLPYREDLSALCRKLGDHARRQIPEAGSDGIVKLRDFLIRTSVLELSSPSNGRPRSRG